MDNDAVRTVQTSYDRLAGEYTARIAGELAGKPLDRALLQAFVEQVGEKNPICDLGCGPGHVAAFLHQLGARVTGIDLSPGMIAQARQRLPAIPFKVGNMLGLEVPDASFAGIVAFYSIIHVPPAELPQVFREMHRVLEAGGRVLIAFHIGDEALHQDALWDIPVDLDFQFLQPQQVTALLLEAGFVIEATTLRAPYPEVEHQSQRAYLLARKE